MTQEEELVSGQIIRIGQELLRFELIGAPEPTADGTELMGSPNPGYWGKLTVIIGGSFGAGNYGMAGRAYSPRFLWMWPNARISVMGGDQAATVLSSVASDRDPAQIEALRRRIRAQYEAQGHPYYATARLWDDGVIDPLATRDVVGLALNACSNAPLGEITRPVFRM
ncbi:MAG: hypothetical protein KY463_06595 [Actinobacteria bacterium]|nr:hypothetical protein [Actinomycetota bacterium]